MNKKRVLYFISIAGVLSLSFLAAMAFGLSDAYRGNIYQVGTLKPIDSILRVKVGDRALDFSLPSVSGEKVSLDKYRGKKKIKQSHLDRWGPVSSCLDPNGLWPFRCLQGEYLSGGNA